MHVASPVGMTGKEDTYVKPAVEGTLSVLEAASKHGVKRVIVTSSVATIHNDNKHKEVYDESDQSIIDKKTIPYIKSKVLAENAIRDFMQNEKPSFTIATIHPALIIGPGVLSESTSSIAAIKDFMMRKYPAVPKFYFGVSDVRDVADAHVKAL